MLWKILGYSEFLISFAMLNNLLFCFQNQVNSLLKGNGYTVLGAGNNVVAAYDIHTISFGFHSADRYIHWNYEICLLPYLSISAFFLGWNVLPVKESLLS